MQVMSTGRKTSVDKATGLVAQSDGGYLWKQMRVTRTIKFMLIALDRMGVKLLDPSTDGTVYTDDSVSSILWLDSDEALGGSCPMRLPLDIENFSGSDHSCILVSSKDTLDILKSNISDVKRSPSDSRAHRLYTHGPPHCSVGYRKLPRMETACSAGCYVDQDWVNCQRLVTGATKLSCYRFEGDVPEPSQSLNITVERSNRGSTRERIPFIVTR